MFRRLNARVPSLPALLLVLCVSAFAQRGSAQSPSPWIELRSTNFTVYSNGGEKAAARIAVQFEQIRDVFTKISKNLRVDPGQPIVILAAKDEKSLAALLPEYYSDKDRVHPAGIFIPRTERNYIVLRANVDSDLPFATLYHEYTHQVTDLNAAFMPTWFSEGYAEFFGYSKIAGRRVSIGWAPEGALYFLQQSKLLPLEELFRVDHRSPYYNEGKKANVFYAQSWALIHMLFMAPEFRESDRLTAYLTNVNQGLDPPDAARRAFGDLNALQKKLESYIRAGRYFHYEMNSPIEEIAKSFAVRSPSEAESAAVLGTYYLDHEQTTEGLRLLERSLMLEPDLVAANEAMGMMHVRQSEYEQAAPYIERAVRMNSKSFLTYYFHGNLLLQSASDQSTLSAAESSFARCVQLNPNFAPAHAALAHIYGRSEDTLDKALQSARTAAALEPSSWNNQLALAIVLARRREFGQAREIAGRVATNASDPAEADAAASALTFIADTEQYQAERRSDETSRRQIVAPNSSEGAVALARRRGAAEEAEQLPVATETPEAPPAVPKASEASPSTTPTRRVYSMRGRIVALDCSAAPKVTLTLSLGGLSMKLMTSDFSQVSLLNEAGASLVGKLRCEQLGGITARLLYTLTPGEPYDGEFHMVSLQPLVP